MQYYITNTKIIKTLTEEVVALKTEVKQQRNMREKDDTSLIPSLPFMDVKDFIDFDTKLLLNDNITSQLKNIIYRVGGKDFLSFLRMALKSITSDAMAVNLTWRGTNDKPSIQRFTTFALIKNACHSKYSNSTDMDINKVCQQHILHARDRVQKKKKKQTNN
ncbi:uncharacterized protein LOC126765753 [Bactrocera neohumeralis]|uniref:uncharacterized protein LOC126765753 n=1 Tax=Bactrocera neohumeralis TaxID=98809 RepID=UPI002165E84E|nr:uncharacterized protein LOC126765753 [Bactrocera neohumeralis]